MAGGRPGRRVRSVGEAREGVDDNFMAYNHQSKNFIGQGLRSPKHPHPGCFLSPRRRSERNLPSSTCPVFQGNPSGVAKKVMGTPRPGASVTRTITLRKIKPRNQQDQVKESDLIPRRSPRISLKENKENSPPAAPENQSPHGGEAPRKGQSLTPCCSLNLDAETSPKETNILSPVSANTPGSPECERDLTMAKRVRRSYSRLDVSLSHSFTDKPEFPSFSLAGTSTPAGGPGKRQTFFGFEKLLLPGELAEPAALHLISVPKTAVEESGAIGKPDTDIPGISFGRLKRRKKKVPEFDKSKMDEWAAQMNAEFEEAEKFDLLVE